MAISKPTSSLTKIYYWSLILKFFLTALVLVKSCFSLEIPPYHGISDFKNWLEYIQNLTDAGKLLYPQTRISVLPYSSFFLSYT